MESRNLILAIVLSIGVLFIWSFFFEAPEQQNLDEFSLDEEVSEVNSDELNMEAIAEIEESLGIDNASTIDLSEALGKDQRVNISTQSISGSINLKGLKQFKSFNYEIPGDISSAAFFIILTLLAKNSSLKIKNVNIV